MFFGEQFRQKKEKKKTNKKNTYSTSMIFLSFFTGVSVHELLYIHCIKY